MRRTLALLLTVVMLVSMLSFGTTAETTYVAKIIKSDTTERGQYTTLTDANAALQDGDTLVLLKDATTLTINASGKHVTVTAQPGVKITASITVATASSATIRGSVILEGLTINSSLPSTNKTGRNVVYIKNYNDVILSSCTIIADNQGTGTMMAVTIDGSNANTTLAINDCTITAKNKAYLMYARTSNTITAENSTFISSSTKGMISIDKTFGGGSISFTGCTFKESYAAYIFNAVTKQVVASFKDCTFSTTKNKAILNLTSGCHVTLDNVVFNIPSVYSSATYVMTGDPYLRIYSAKFANSSANNIKLASFNSWDLPEAYVVSSNSILDWTVYNDKLAAVADIQEITSSASEGARSVASDGIEIILAEQTKICPQTSEAVAAKKTEILSAVYIYQYKEAAEAELRKTASGATDQRILDILSSAIADVWDETNSTAISVDEAKQKGNISIGEAQLKLDAEKELRTVASGATDQRVLDMLSSGIAFIWEADGSNLTSRKNYITRSLKLTIYKVAAETEVKDYSEGSSYPAVVEIVSSATETIWSTAIATNSAVDKIVADAKVEMDKYKAMIAAEAEIREYASSATDERILEIVSSACAEIWNKATSSAVLEFQQETYAKIDLINAKIAAVAAINAAAGEDEILKLYAEVFNDTVNDSEDAQFIETFKQKAINAFALVKAKAAAIKQLNSILEHEDEAIRAIASASIDQVKSSATLTAEQVAEILSKAIADIVFEAYKNDAQTAVKAAEDAQNAAVVEIVSNAIADIEVATTKVAIDEIKSNALADVALEKAKAAAIAEINSEAISSSAAMQTIVSGAIADVNAAKTLEAVETARSAAIVAIRAQLVAEAPKTADSTIWFVVVAAVAMLGCATVAKKKFF